MFECDIISSSDEEDVPKHSNANTFQSPPRKKSAIKPFKATFSNNTKNVIHTQETIVKCSKYLLGYANFNKIKHENYPLDLYNPFNHSKCYIYCRINDILCMNDKDINSHKKIKVIGLYRKNKVNNHILFDKHYCTSIHLSFQKTESIPIVLSNVIVMGILNYSTGTKPLVNVNNWKYINESLITKFDNIMYSHKTYIQEKNIELWLNNSTINIIKPKIETDSYNARSMKQFQLDEIFKIEAKRLLNINADLFE